MTGKGSAVALWPLVDVALAFAKQSHLRTNGILEVFPGDPRDVHVYRGGWRDVTLGAAGGLEALELVQGLVETPLYGGLVAREFGEGVRFV